VEDIGTRTYHLDGLVQITDAWASLGGRHYRIEDIARVELSGMHTEYALAGAALYFVVSAMFVSVAATIWAWPSNQGGLGCWLGLFILLTWVFVLWLALRIGTSRPMYLIKLKCSFGRVNAFVCSDRDYAKIVHTALRQAVKDKAKEQQLG
jgi:hypothetical protein